MLSLTTIFNYFHLTPKGIKYLLSRGIPKSNMRGLASFDTRMEVVKVLRFFDKIHLAHLNLWCIEKEYYKMFFEEGILIPVYNEEKEVVCLQIRNMSTNIKDMRYLSYGKSSALGYINNHLPRVCLTEGYFEAISGYITHPDKTWCFFNGVSNIGTAINSILWDYLDKDLESIEVFLDNDTAGREAKKKASSHSKVSYTLLDKDLNSQLKKRGVK